MFIQRSSLGLSPLELPEDCDTFQDQDHIGSERERKTPAESFGNQIIGGGAISSSAYNMPAMRSVNPSGGRWVGSFSKLLAL